MRVIRITIPHAELLGSLEKWSYTIGEKIGDDAAKERHLVQGLADRGHAELIQERLDDAWNDVLHALSAYTVKRRSSDGCAYEYCTSQGCHLAKEEEVEEEYEDMRECHDYHIVLYMPDGTYPSVGHQVALLVKDYLIRKGRAGWLEMLGQSSDLELLNAEKKLAKLRVVLNSRVNVGHIKRWNYGY